VWTFASQLSRPPPSFFLLFFKSLNSFIYCFYLPKFRPTRSFTQLELLLLTKKVANMRGKICEKKLKRRICFHCRRWLLDIGKILEKMFVPFFSSVWFPRKPPGLLLWNAAGHEKIKTSSCLPWTSFRASNNKPVLYSRLRAEFDYCTYISTIYSARSAWKNDLIYSTTFRWKDSILWVCVCIFF
jgi:hypothetical protein